MKIQFTKIVEKLVTVELTEEEYKNLYNEDYVEVIIAAANSDKLKTTEEEIKIDYPEDDRNFKIEF